MRLTETFDPDVAAWLVARSTDPHAAEPSVRGMRLQSRLANQLARARIPTPDRPAAEHDIRVPGPHGPVPARLLRPSVSDLPPLVVYFHGGGWVAGGLDTHAHHVRRICAQTNAAVLSVDYRLAPEHRFPAAFDDCTAAVRWASEHAAEVGVDGARIAVAGDSAGAQLAASVAIWCRDQGLRLIAAALIAPVIDLSGGYRSPAVNATYPSRTENAEGYGLTLDGMASFVSLYGVESSEVDWRSSPWHADDLTGIAPTILYTAGFDVLRDEGIAYAERLRRAGVRVLHRNLPTLNHSFFGLMGVSPVADAASRRVCRDLAEGLLTLDCDMR